MCEVFLARGILGLFFLFFLQFLDDFGDNGLLLFGGHLGQREQRVLQRHILRIHSEFVKHVAALLEHIVVGVVIVDQRNGLGIAHLCIVILASGEVDAAQRELADGFVHAVAGALFGSEPVVLDGAERIAVGEVQVADGVVDLVQIVLVAVIAGHALQGLDLAGDVGALIHCALLDARVELGAVGRTAAAACLLVGQIGVALVPDIFIELSEQETHAGLLVALEALDGF